MNTSRNSILLGQSEDIAYSTNLRKSNHKMRKVNHMRDDNMIVGNLECDWRKFEKKALQQQPRTKVTIKVMTEFMTVFRSNLSKKESKQFKQMNSTRPGVRKK